MRGSGISAKIDKEGFLVIKRGDRMQHQLCAFRDGRICGDSCPLFVEAILKETGRLSYVSLKCSPGNACWSIDEDDRVNEKET